MSASSRDRYRLAVVLIVVVCAIATAGSTGAGAATPAVVTRITAAETATNVQLSVVASAPVTYRFVNVQPNWIVFQLSPAELQGRAGTLPFAGGAVTRIRVGQFQPQVVRIVVELKRPMPFRVVPAHDELVLLVGAAGDAPSASTVGRMLPDSAPAHGGRGVALPSAAPVTPSRPQPVARPLRAVVPGQAVGPVRLGMRVQDAVAALGPAKTTQPLPDGNMLYEWFGPPSNRGVGARVSPSGTIYRVWVLNDSEYGIAEGVHVGSTEAEVRAALGAPAQELVDTARAIKTMTYPSLGLWVSIQMDRRYSFYDQVFEIGVTKPEPGAGR